MAVIRIESPVIAALLAGSHDIECPVMRDNREEVRARTEIIIRPLRIGAWGSRSEEAGGVVEIGALYLVAPSNSPGCQIQGKNAVDIILRTHACQLCLGGLSLLDTRRDTIGNGIVISGGGVQSPPSPIDRKTAAPDRSAGITLGYRISFPEDLTGIKIQCVDAPAKRKLISSARENEAFFF